MLCKGATTRGKSSVDLQPDHDSLWCASHLFLVSAAADDDNDDGSDGEYERRPSMKSNAAMEDFGHDRTPRKY